MARGDWVTFEEFSLDVGSKVHDLANDTLKLLLINNSTAPTAADATPRLADYVGNEVDSTSGGYSANGIALTSSGYTEAGGVSTLDDSGNISLAQDASGFTNAYWGVLYNDTAAADQAIGYLDLGGPVSEVAGAITITWNAGGITTVTVDS